MGNRQTIAFMCLMAGAFSLAAADADPVAVIKRVIAKVAAAANRMPNYTCVETVERRRYQPLAATLPRACSVILQQLGHPTVDLKPQLNSIDRLRLDVTMAKRGEIFSWAGASKFDDDGIEHLIRVGPISTGGFGSYLASVLGNESAQLSFSRNIRDADRDLLEYSYQISLADSKYRIRIGQAWVYTAYSGSFWVDPATDEVVRMVVRTAELPEAAGACVSTAIMDFTTVTIGPSMVRLPEHLTQTWIAANGYDVENTTSFTSCREFMGESTLTFLSDGSVPATVPREQGRASVAEPVPAGLRFALLLTAPIDTSTAAAGDLFRATLAEPLREAKSAVIAPKGAIVEGRLLRVQTMERPPQVLVVLHPRYILVDGVQRPLVASPDIASAGIINREGVHARFRIYLPQSGEEQSGVFGFAGTHVVVPKGFRSEWRTASPSP